MATSGFLVRSSDHSAFTNPGELYLEREASEPDPHIVDLNSELTRCEGHISTAVGERERAYVSFATLLDLGPYVSSTPSRFAFEGMGQLLEHHSVSEAKRICPENANDIKMIWKILALRRGIKTLTSDTRGADFDRVKYHTLFFRTSAVFAPCR